MPALLALRHMIDVSARDDNQYCSWSALCVDESLNTELELNQDAGADPDLVAAIKRQRQLHSKIN